MKCSLEASGNEAKWQHLYSYWFNVCTLGNEEVWPARHRLDFTPCSLQYTCNLYLYGTKVIAWNWNWNPCFPAPSAVH